MKYRAVANHDEHRTVIAWCGVDSAGNHWDVVGDAPQTMDARSTAGFIADALNSLYCNDQAPPQAERRVVAVVGDNLSIIPLKAYRNADGALVYTRYAESPQTAEELVANGYKLLYSADGEQ